MSSRSPRKFSLKTMHAFALDWPNLVSRIPDATRVIPARTKYTASTVGKWLQGLAKPSGDSVATLLMEFDEFHDAIIEATNRKREGLTAVQTRKLLEVLGENNG